MDTNGTCKVCRFSVMRRIDPIDLRSIRVCHLNPPTPVVAQMPNGQVGIRAMHPIVEDTESCFQFEIMPGQTPMEAVGAPKSN